MAYTLPAGMRVRVKISYKDSHGNPATIDGDVDWSSSAPDIVAVTPAESTEPVPTPQTTGSEVWLTALGALGAAQITAVADADLGVGVRELITLMDVNVVGGEAVAGTIEPVGSPEDAPVINPL